MALTKRNFGGNLGEKLANRSNERTVRLVSRSQASFRRRVDDTSPTLNVSSVVRMKQRVKPPFADVRTCISLSCVYRVSCLSTIHKWLRDTPRKHDLFERFHRRSILSSILWSVFGILSSRYVSVFTIVGDRGCT